jgi:hypothetical protein
MHQSERHPSPCSYQLVCILPLHYYPCCLDDILRILDQFPAILRELVNIDWGGILDISEVLVYMLVIGHAALAECFDHV